MHIGFSYKQLQQKQAPTTYASVWQTANFCTKKNKKQKQKQQFNKHFALFQFSIYACVCGWISIPHTDMQHVQLKVSECQHAEGDGACNVCNCQQRNVGQAYIQTYILLYYM